MCVFCFFFLLNPVFLGTLTSPSSLTRGQIGFFITVLSSKQIKPALLLDLAPVNYLFKFDIIFTLCILFLMRHIHHIVFWGGLQARKIQDHH